MKTAVCGRGIPSNTRHLQLRRAVVAVCLGFTQWAAAATIHVWSGSPADGPGTTWGNAFHAVQSGVDAAGPGDTVLVTNEVQVLAQTVTLSKAATLRGVRGAIIDGNGAVRCLVLNHADTVVEGLTIRNGYTASIGGGICVNTAGGTIRECVISGCRAEYGGGVMFVAEAGLMDRCVVLSNRADVATQKQGGGVCWLAGGDAANSILQENLAFGPGTNYLLEAGVAGLNYCCTVPLPETGSGNLAASPLFFDPGAGDYHPGPDSPCIDAGSDALAAGTGDLDGLPRINGVAVDMGAYEWASIHYVAPGGGHLSPFGSWATAATNIQEALDRARGGDRVLVSNGTYRIASALNISRGVTLVGIAGREATIVDAQNLCRCLVIHHASDVVEGFTFTRGYAPEAWGAGVHFSALGGTLRNCRVTGCTGDNGIGVHFSQAGGLVEGCLIDNNIRIMGGMDSYGAGVYFTSFGAEVRNCIITDNLANFGGAVYMPHGGTVANSVLARNYASQGGGAYCNWHQSFFYNCTIVGNSAIYGGGFLSSYGGTLESCILYHNTASLSGPNFYQMGGSSGFACYNSCCAQTPPGSGNITANPLLKNLGGGDYHLSPDSPCINAGLVYRGTIDLDGNPRVAEGVVDMGAYERPGCYYVAPAGAHRVPYASWDAAATNLQAALDEAHAGAKVLVTNGVYAGNLAAARAVTLESVEGRGATSITGGDIHPCATLGAAVTLDGFTLEHGCGEQGGGLHVAATGATIRNCLVRACAAPDGAGIYFASGTGTVENCILRSNQTSGSPGRGGGLFLRPGVEIVGSVLEDNQATEGGGAYLYQGGALRQCRVATNAATSGGGAYLYQGGAVDRCRVTANQAASGGGLYVFQSGTAVNSLLAGNGADNGAGAYFNYGGALRHCTLGGNTAAASGGGVFCKSGTLVQNTILWDNAAGAGGTNWYNSGTGMTYEHCCTAPAPAGVGHVTADPRLAADGVHLLYSSPCADAGKMPDVPVSVDLDGAPRPVDGSFDGLAAYDIGASEYDPETADSNGDGVPDGWCHGFGLDPLLPGLAGGNPDGDPFTTGEEWTADTNPTNGASFFRITGIQPGPPPGVWVDTSDRRVYTLQWRERFEEGGWQDVPGQVGVAGTGGPMGLFHEGTAPANGFYRVKVAP